MASLLKFFGFDTGPIKAVESLSLSLSWGWAGMVLLLLLLVPIILYFYRFEERQISVSDKRTFLGLRLLFVVLFALLLAGPIIVVSGNIPQKNRLAVLIDSSRSMSIKADDETRLEKVKKAFSERKLLARLQNKTGIMPEIFSFAENVSPISPQEIEQFSIKPTGNQTDISGAAKNLIGNLGEGSLLGLIMLTDGVHTIGENPAVTLANLRTPVYFVGPGGHDASIDWAINVPRPPATGYLNSSVRVRGEVSRYNLADSSIKVKVTRDGEPFDEIEVRFDGQSNRAAFALNIPCDKEGSSRFELSVPVTEGEITDENNSAGFLLKVVRERLNILAVSGEPSWETKFFINAVSTDPNAHLVSWVRLKDDRWLCNREFKVQKAVRKPTLTEDFKNCDVLVLRGVPFGFIQGLAEEIVARLESGSLGLLILPAGKGLSGLGYQGTGLEKILPVKLGSENWRGTPGNMILPSADTAYNFLRLADDPIENLEFFATLPKFEGLYEYGEKSAGAEIILSSTVRNGADPLPFMVRNRVGQGNIIMITGGPLWPAGFRLVPSDRGLAPYAALMVNMMKWLANRREDAQVSIEMPASRGYIGQPSRIRVWVSNARHQLQSGAQVSINVVDEKNQSTALTCMETSEKGCYEATFVPAYRGMHRIEASARLQGREAGNSKIEFLVENPTAEFEDPQIKVDLMTRLASETGGIYTDVANIEPLISAINVVPGQKLETRMLDLRDSWAILLLMLVFPLAEWYLRRIRGLS
jgi:hypothetical protein